MDPSNYKENRIPQGYSETQYISELLTKVVVFAIKYDIHVLLVAHPTKMQKDKDENYKVPTPVSYTHLDVYKRQIMKMVMIMKMKRKKIQI